jgi:hypothetical protein
MHSGHTAARRCRSSAHFKDAHPLNDARLCSARSDATGWTPLRNRPKSLIVRLKPVGKSRGEKTERERRKKEDVFWDLDDTDVTDIG